MANVVNARAAGESLAESFAQDGYLHLRGALDLDRYIRPVQRELGALIQRAARCCGDDYAIPAEPAEFDAGYLDLIARCPQAGPLVYDMSKTLLSFQRLVTSDPLHELFRALRRTQFAGTAPGSSGIRIDRPGISKHMTAWHQEFPYQFRSLDGITFWLPLVSTTLEMGPVVLARGSHRDGIERIVDRSGNAEANMLAGSYGDQHVEHESTIPERYTIVQPPSEPGDMLVFDFLTLHASGANAGGRTRWSAQIRYFNFDDPYGASIRWSGGVKDGKTLDQINAELQRAVNFGALR